MNLNHNETKVYFIWHTFQSVFFKAENPETRELFSYFQIANLAFIVIMGLVCY